MTMLTHTHGPFERTPHSSGARSPAAARSAAAQLSMIKRFCVGAVTILAAWAAVAAIMALKIAVYLPPIIHH
jgi:hypothetical protein